MCIVLSKLRERRAGIILYRKKQRIADQVACPKPSVHDTQNKRRKLLKVTANKIPQVKRLSPSNRTFGPSDFFVTFCEYFLDLPQLLTPSTSPTHKYIKPVSAAAADQTAAHPAAPYGSVPSIVTKV